MMNGIRNAMDIYANRASDAMQATQEAIVGNSSVSNSPALSLNSGGRMVSAGILSLTLVLFLSGLFWALGEATGESVFRKVQQVV